MDTDRIERDILVAAPVERVWAMLTEPEHIANWFGDSAKIDRLAPGETLTLGWSQYGDYPAVIERVEPPKLFSFRWVVDDNDHPGEDSQYPREGNSTLVEFTLAEEGTGTRLRVVESGFSTLAMPPERQQGHLEQNTEGWDIELGELRRYAESPQS